MGDEQADDLQGDDVEVTHDEGEDDHEVGDELGGDGEEDEGGHAAALVLVDGVAEGHDEAGDEGWVGTGEEGGVAPG